MVHIRPSSTSAATPPANDPLPAGQANAAVPGPEQAPTGPNAGTDPLAKFGAMHGLHAFARQGGEANGNAPLGNAPLLYTKQEAPGGAGVKAPPPQTCDIASVKQAQIDALKQYPAGITQADVDKLTQRDIPRSTIEALKNSKKPAERAYGERLERDRARGDALEAQRRLGVTIEKAKIAYADLLNQKPPAKIYVTTSAGNGGQPVLVIVGPGFNPKLPVRHVHTHYHGDNATVADPAGSKAGTNSRIADQLKREPQSVWVLPESTARPKAKVEWPQQPDTPSHNGFYKANWDHVRSQVQTTADALKAAGVDGSKAKHVVSFHSRGGEALINIMRTDKTGAGLKADRLELHDCLYGSQHSVAAWGGTANGKAAGRVVVYQGWLEASRADVIKAAFKTPPGASVPRFEQIDVHRKHVEAMKKDKSHEDSVNPVYSDGTAKKYSRATETVKDRKGVEHKVPIPLRQFDPDRHYRTTGQYLDTEPGP